MSAFQETAVQPIADVRDISRIAYGFMASRALFAALEFDIFSYLSGRSNTVAELVLESGIGPIRCF